jgi:heptosyltransferase-2
MTTHHVLVVAPNWIGDAIMAQPLLRRLNHNLPAGEQAHIAVLAPPHVAPALECMPEVGEVIAEPFVHGKLQWSERLALARRMRQRPQEFEAAYVLPNSLKSALVPWLAHIPVRVGLSGELRFGLLTRRLPNPPRRSGPKQHRPPIASTYASFAGPLPAGFDPRGVDRPKLTIPESTVAIAKARHLGAASIAIGLCPGAEYGPAKRWPVEHFARLADLIAAARPDARIVCLGGPKDREIAQQIAHATRAQITNLCGQTPLKDAIALIAGLQAVVTNDSGLMHVAAALDVPLVALYGSTDPQHTPPHSPVAQIARIDIACSPCFERECPLGHFKCMRDLQPEVVAQMLEVRLAPRHSIAT